MTIMHIAPGRDAETEHTRAGESAWSPMRLGVQAIGRFGHRSER